MHYGDLGLVGHSGPSIFPDGIIRSNALYRVTSCVDMATRSDIRLAITGRRVYSWAYKTPPRTFYPAPAAFSERRRVRRARRRHLGWRHDHRADGREKAGQDP